MYAKYVSGSVEGTGARTDYNSFQANIFSFLLWFRRSNLINGLRPKVNTLTLLVRTSID